MKQDTSENEFDLFEVLERINRRPIPFETYTARDLWTDDYTSKQMLSFHLNGAVDISSRNFDFIDRSAGWIVSRFDVGKGTKIADFGCGPGLYTTRLAKTQAEITGIDFSIRSIQYARDVAEKEGLSVNYINEDYLKFDTPDRYDLVLMIMCDFCALSPVQRGELLRRFFKSLNSGGAVLLDVYSLNAFAEREETMKYEVNLLDGFWSPNKYYGFLNTYKYEVEKVTLDRYTIVEPNRSRVVFNWLQYFNVETITREFTENGFEIEAIYSDVAGNPFREDSHELAVIARKAY